MLTLLLVELIFFELWGMLTSLAGHYRTSVLSNSDCKPGFKALKACIVLLSCGSTVIFRDHQVYSLLMLRGRLLM